MSDGKWDELLKPWSTEPPPVPERQFTPWAEPGWTAWNVHAVEVQVANFLGELSTRFDTVLETGVGQGFVTRRLSNLAWLYESDYEWRARIPRIALMASPLIEAPHSIVDLWVLDSNFPLRIAEWLYWLEYGDPDSVCFVHDTGTKHRPASAHAWMGLTIRQWHGGGMFLDNPRGSWIGLKDPQYPVPAFIEELWQKHHP